MEPLLESPDIEALARDLGTSLTRGLPTGERLQRLQAYGRNAVPAPLPCPKWMCCLLPCLMGTPRMKEYRRVCPNYASVLRLGQEVELDAGDLVPGDVVLLRTGERVPADCRYSRRRGAPVPLRPNSLRRQWPLVLARRVFQHSDDFRVSVPETRSATGSVDWRARRRSMQARWSHTTRSNPGKLRQWHPTWSAATRGRWWSRPGRARCGRE